MSVTKNRANVQQGPYAREEINDRKYSVTITPSAAFVLSFGESGPENSSGEYGGWNSPDLEDRFDDEYLSDPMRDNDEEDGGCYYANPDPFDCDSGAGFLYFQEYQAIMDLFEEASE